MYSSKRFFCSQSRARFRVRLLATALVCCALAASVSGRPEPHKRKQLEKAGANLELREKFESIFSQKIWGQEGAGSGTGSTVSATSITRSILRSVINKFELRGMLDAPCGAMAWMPLALRELKEDTPAFRYLGVDIVRSLIQENKRKFENESDWMQFRAIDFSEETVRGQFDLIFSRDALQHLPMEAVVKALEKFSQSRARFLLVGSYLTHESPNQGINLTTDFLGIDFKINLAAEPFSLTGYQHAYNEHTHETSVYGDPDKFLLLYPISYLQSIDFDQMRQRAQIFGS